MQGADMNPSTTPDRNKFSMAPRALLDIPDIAGTRITCCRGSLWVTLDNDPRDIVLEAGESFFGSEHRRALVYAFQASDVDMSPVTAATAPQALQAGSARHNRTAFAR
jgi:hypothetical protein